MSTTLRHLSLLSNHRRKEPTMQEIITQKCTKCKTEKTFDMFSKDKRRKYGVQPICKNCNKLYYLNNINNVDNRIKEYRKEYKRKNKDILNLKRRIYYENNKEKHISYYKLNKEKIAKYYREYFKTELGKVASKNARHKRRLKLKNGDVTNEQLLELQQNSKVCYWCNTTLKNKVVHIDHYVPLAKGGKHTLDNLVVSCEKCNRSKHAKDPIKFANSIGKLL